LRITIARFAVSVAALASLLCTSAHAQWIDYPTRGIPRTADGKPNLTAPAPKTADGKPDLSGMWEHLNSRTTAYYLDGIDIPWQPGAKALFDQNTADNQINNPESKCLPRGTPKADAFDVHKIIQTPELIVILYEYQTTYRQIFFDGRASQRSQSNVGRIFRGALGGRHAGGGIERLQREGLAFRARQSNFGRTASH
jgi:hypothetical protein